MKMNMKTMTSKKNLLAVIAAAMALTACEIDNYSGPNAGISGRFIDAETGEMVAQDIIRGTQIDMLEHGYNATTPQYHLRVKTDGSYANTMMFANTYTVQPVRGNFVAVEPQDIDVNGITELDFNVLPYIRVRDATIARSGDRIVASFRLEQTIPTNVRKAGLYVHYDASVGEPFRLVAAEIDINGVVDPNQVHSVEIDVPANSSLLVSGQEYFCRVGAIIDVGDAKANYSPTIRIPL
jgi:hypothetical protein